MANSPSKKTKAPKAPRALSTSKSAVAARRWAERNSRCHGLASNAYKAESDDNMKLSSAKLAWLACRKQSFHKAASRLENTGIDDVSVSAHGKQVTVRCRLFDNGGISCVGGKKGSPTSTREPSQKWIKGKRSAPALPANLLGLSKGQLGKLRGLLGD